MESAFPEATKKPPRNNRQTYRIIGNVQLAVKLGEFTKEEIVALLNVIQNRKAVCTDEISLKVWKTRQFIEAFQINNLMYMDDIKLFAKNEKFIETYIK